MHDAHDTTENVSAKPSTAMVCSIPAMSSMRRRPCMQQEITKEQKLSY